MSRLVTTPPIQVFQPQFRVEETLEEIRKCLEVGWTGAGFRTLEIEAAWRAYTGLPHAYFTNSATSALHAAVALCKQRGGWQDGDEVISTPLTFVATNHVILYERLQVTFADVDEMLCLDPDDVERKIGPRTRAVIFVGLGGNPGQLVRLSELCRARGLTLILDATHMAGTKLDGRDAGHLADISCYSFHAVKNLPTADSGMFCCHDPELDVLVRRFGWMGITRDTYTRAQDGPYQWDYDVTMLGHKYHGNSIAAAIALVGLRYLDTDNAFRRQLAEAYDDALEGVDAIRHVPMAPDCTPSRLLYQVRLDDREAALTALQAHGVFPGVHYRDNTDYPMYAHGRLTCPRAHQAAGDLLSLPLHLRLSRSDVLHVAQALRSHLGA